MEIASKKKLNAHDCQKELSLVFITPGDYPGLLEKGVATMILERDEGGFFKKVFNVHPYASKTQTFDLNDTHRLIEFGKNYPFSFLNSHLGKRVNFLFKAVWIAKTLTSLVRREHIDVIRATDPYLCGFYAWLLSKRTGVPFCVSIHTDYDRTFKLSGRKKGAPFLFKMLERFVLPRAQVVMPIREHLVQDMVRKGADPSKIRVIPHGISMEEFSLAQDEDIFGRYGIPCGKKIISFVGRLDKDNYVYDIVEVAHRISQMRDDFVVLLVGDGAERDKLKSLVHEYGLSSIILFTGFQTRNMVISIRRRSLIALCLKGGFSLIEACAAGCLPISYNIEWHYELVKNQETGFLVNENDLDALAETVIYLLDHPNMAKEMGARARDLATARHELAQTSEIKRNCYKELLRLKTS